MKVRYTRRAFDQLSMILDYIDARSPEDAENVKRRINAAIAVLSDHPHSGRATNRAGFRRIVAYPYPYLIVYQPIAGDRHLWRSPCLAPSARLNLTSLRCRRIPR